MAISVDADVGRSFEALGEEECLNLLHQGWLGRVAVTLGAIPAVFPVNYCVEAGAIYFLTGAGTKLAAAVKGSVLAFEIDEADLAYHHGWSVLAVGEAHEVHDENVKQMVAGRLEPWAPGDRTHLIRIWPDFLSGRRIAFGLPIHSEGHARNGEEGES